LALEAFSASDQKWLDAFASGHINEQALQERTCWQERWGFPWENYAPLLLLARDQKMKIVGINVGARGRQRHSLHRRDRFSAEIICHWQSRFPKHLIYAIVGDLHLARTHLPKAVEQLAKRQGRRLRTVTVLQNSEHLYFRLARLGREHQVEVLCAARNRFCVLSSPPWVKWQSYLMYLESTYDRELSADRLELTDHVAKFAIFIAHELGLQTDLTALAVYSPEQGHAISKWRQSLPVGRRHLLDHLLRADRSFYFVEKGILYLSRLSINHAATLAGQYLHGQLCDRQRDLWEYPNDFLPAIWVEAVGFFCSKLINHRRKAEGLKDLKIKLESSDPKGRGQSSLKLALEQRLREVRGRGPHKSIRPRRKESYLEAAQILGAMLGERMYRGYSQKKISASEIIDWLQLRIDSDEFSTHYFNIVRRCESFARGEGSS